jgi:hypothetical protein
MLKPCQFRQVTNDGLLVCSKITGPNREVTAEICQACPVAAIDCQHLRVSLTKEESGSIIVRYGNGRSEVLEGEPSGVRMQKAACAALAVQVSGPQMCVGCALHAPASTAGRQAIGRRVADAGKILTMPAPQGKCATC